MLMEMMRWLREAGVAVEQPTSPPRPGAQADAILELVAGDKRVRFAVEEKRRAPYPNELPRLRVQEQTLRREGQPLLVVPFVPETLGGALTEAGWSWADTQGNFDLRGPALMLRQRRTRAAPKPKPKTLPQGSGSLAIIRALIRFTEGEEEAAGATALAAQAKVSQPRVSQVLRQLRDLNLVEPAASGRWRPYREALLDRFLAEYAGPRGSERCLYSLDSPTDVAVLAARTDAPQGSVVVSADVGPDLVLSWRRPSVVILYTKYEIPAEDLRLTEAQGRHDANVLMRIPDDQSVFPVLPKLVADVQGVELTLTDPSQMIWDLQDLGGTDRLEAAGMLREWLLTRP